MYSFLVLVPLTLITAALGGILIFSPQMRDYVEFIATLGGDADKTRLAIQIAAHIAAYAICCIVLVATTRTISAPVSRDRPDMLCRVQMALEAIFVAVPSLVILALATFVVVRRVEVATGVQMAVASQELDGPSDSLFKAAAGAAAACLLGVILSGRPQEARRFAWTLVAIVAGIPIMLWLALLGRVFPTGEASLLLTLAAAVAAVGLAASVAAIVTIGHPLELFRSTLRPFSVTLVDLFAALAFAGCTAVAASLIWRPVDGATFLGLFPVFFLVSAAALVVVARIFARGSSPVAIVSVAVSVVVAMHFLDFLTPTREFRYRPDPPPHKLESGVAARDVLKARGIMDLRDAFLAWLQVREPAIKAYSKKGRTYPVIVVAAQGGGVYAAYHSALSLARLYDSCPEIVDHMFVLSGVSGGALGSAVFAELVHSVPEALRTKPGEAAEGCNPRPGAPKLEDKVKAFFAADFLTPVVDSALLFDFPSLFVPWLRIPMDRAYALEYAFEAAWAKMAKETRAPRARHRAGDQTPAYGLEANFYGRWRPDGPAPALFLGATGVNSGIPVVVSQVKWGQGQSLPVRSVPVAAGREEELDELLRRAQAQSERRRSSVTANILDFRPDLQMAMSTAVGLSARFPYVTPPANIKRNPKIELSYFGGIDVLEILDGAYFDNSGGWVAIDLLDDLERYLRPRRWDGSLYDAFKPFASDIRFHLIRFTDRPAQRKGAADKNEHFELLTPLVAFDTVRSARGAQLRGVRDLDRTRETFFYLSDPWFTPSLNWLLSHETKAKIELRSNGAAKAGNEVCCLMKPLIDETAAAQPGRRWRRREILLVTSWEEAQKLNALLIERRSSSPTQAPWEVVKFVPNNAAAFDGVLRLIKEGDEAVDLALLAKN